MSASVRRQAPCAACGMALVAVLWIVAALSIFAMGLAGATRAEIRSAQGARAFAEAAAYGDAAIELAVRELHFAEKTIDRSFATAYEIDGRRIGVRISPGGGYVDLNGASQALLHDLFAFGAGLESDQAETLAQRVVDWRDADDEPLPLGAEDADYEAAGVAFRTRGGPFETPEDLLQVLGVGFDTYDKIRDLLATWTGAGGIDPLAAPPAMFKILAPGDLRAAETYLALREAGEPAIDTTAFNQEHILLSSGSIFRLEASYPADQGRVLARVRWVDAATPGIAGLPWRTLRIEPVRSIPMKGGNGGGNGA